MITPYQAAELRRRIEAALNAAWKAGSFADDKVPPTEDEVTSVGDSEVADQRLFRYVDHLAKRKSKSEKR